MKTVFLVEHSNETTSLIGLLFDKSYFCCIERWRVTTTRKRDVKFWRFSQNLSDESIVKPAQLLGTSYFTFDIFHVFAP